MRDEIKQALGAFMGLELETLSEALTQYVDNSDIEDEPSEIAQARIRTAESLLDAVNTKLVAEKRRSII